PAGQSDNQEDDTGGIQGRSEGQRRLTSCADELPKKKDGSRASTGAVLFLGGGSVKPSARLRRWQGRPACGAADNRLANPRQPRYPWAGWSSFRSACTCRGGPLCSPGNGAFDRTADSGKPGKSLPPSPAHAAKPRF